MTHNIIEWSLMTRLPFVKKLVSDLYANDTKLLAGGGDMGPTKKRKDMHSPGLEMEV